MAQNKNRKPARHNVIGICSLVLTHADSPLPLAARQALLRAQNSAQLQCIVECEGHAFEIRAVPVVTFVDDLAEITGTPALH